MVFSWLIFFSDEERWQWADIQLDNKINKQLDMNKYADIYMTDDVKYGAMYMLHVKYENR